MKNFERYDSYKDTGVEWLGEIPEHWKVKRFQYIFSFGKGLNITKENLQEDGIPCINYGEVHSKYGFEVDPGKHILKCVCRKYLKTSKKSLLNEGDLVFADTSEDIEGSGNFTQLISSQTVFAGYHTVITRPKFIVNQRYLAYVCDSVSFRSQIRQKVKGVKVYSITKSILKGSYLWLAKENEQNAIVHFLDEKCNKLDIAISQKENLIALLKEQKQIIIQNVVTKGINPDAKMKDSGVERIGEIPEHWEILPGLCFFKENKRNNKGMKEDVVLSLSYGRIIIKPKEKLTGLVPESFETYQIVDPGNIIIRSMDLQNDKTSLRTAIAKNKGIITSAYLNLRVFAGDSNFLYYYLHSLDISKYLYKLGSGLRQNLSYIDFKRLLIVSLPIEEQKKIVEHIELQSSKINKAISLQQKLIDKLKEYKNILIDSAVTGKVKVC